MRVCVCVCVWGGGGLSYYLENHLTSLYSFIQIGTMIDLFDQDKRGEFARVFLIVFLYFLESHPTSLYSFIQIGVFLNDHFTDSKRDRHTLCVCVGGGGEMGRQRQKQGGRQRGQLMGSCQQPYTVSTYQTPRPRPR